MRPARGSDRSLTGLVLHQVHGLDHAISGFVRCHAGAVITYDGVCPVSIARPVMAQRWESLTFLHWPFDPDLVQRLLPPGLTAEVYDNRAWVGLVPFFMHVGLPHLPTPPWAGRFAETNVRTYVTDPLGRRGIWFFSLDAARLGAVLAARAAYRLPYYWSAMEVQQSGNHVAYDCTRRWPSPRELHSPSSRVEIEVGAPFAAEELTDFDHFLTARWTLFSATRHGLRYAHAVHRPWPLRRARVHSVRDQLIAAAGLPQPVEEPVAHYSDGVDTLIGAPHRVSS